MVHSNYCRARPSPDFRVGQDLGDDEAAGEGEGGGKGKGRGEGEGKGASEVKGEGKGGGKGQGRDVTNCRLLACFQGTNLIIDLDMFVRSLLRGSGVHLTKRQR